MLSIKIMSEANTSFFSMLGYVYIYVCMHAFEKSNKVTCEGQEKFHLAYGCPEGPIDNVGTMMFCL